MDATTNSGLVGATVFWLNTSTGTQTNASGLFELSKPIKTPAYLVVSYIGYKTDTLLYQNQFEWHIRLKPSGQLGEVEVTDHKESVTFSTIDPMNRQRLNTKELQKAACCNLSESFETNATVDVSYSDALTGSKQIKLLGLDGSYTQTMIDGHPGIRGLSNQFGLTHIPGTWVNAIDITKGVGSVTTGYESMSGQINIELQKPEKSDRLYANLYAGDWGRYEANIHTGHQLNKHWSTVLLTHASTVNKRNDFNKDGFMDAATGYQLGAQSRWKYDVPGKIMSTFGIHAGTENKTGGQLSFTDRSQNENRTAYGVGFQTNHLEAFGKAAFGFEGRPYRSLVVQTSARHYSHDAFYGFKSYQGTEQSTHATVTYQSIISTSDHQFKTGISYMMDRFRERYNDSAFNRFESVPGAFAEYHHERLNKYSVLLGLRTDAHNLYGIWVHPRLHVKINLRAASALRFSAGRGSRVANIFIDQPFLLASNRRVIVEERLRPEVSWNYGSSLTHKFKFFGKNNSIIADVFYTHFEQQVVTDLDAQAQEVRLYNLQGQSYATTAQVEWIIEPVKRFELRAAYKWQDVRTTYHGVLLEKPLIARNRLLLNAAYATRFEKWKFDVTYKWFGSNRIPDTRGNPESLQLPERSQPYFTMNAQITRAFKRWELYVGGENILNFVQSQQIIDPTNPFGNNFDASLIWGPVMGRVLYTGIRLTIK